MNAAYTITPSGIVCFIDGKHSQVPQDHPNYAKIAQALVDGEFSKVLDLMDTRKVVKNWILKNRRFKLDNDKLTLDGEPFTDAVTDKVLRMIDGGHSPDALFNFLSKTRLNPSAIAQRELLLFCVANDFMIHADGDILAYKSVRADFTDIHSGKFRNKVGDVVSMQRRDVDDNRDRTCSYGLHFASHEYASTWTTYGHLMLLKINPADVVSIPSDYNNQKGRCCKYTVIAEISGADKVPPQEVYTDDEIYDFAVVVDHYGNLRKKPSIKTPRKNAQAAKYEFDRKAKVWNRLFAEYNTLTEIAPVYCRARRDEIADKLNDILREMRELADVWNFEVPDGIFKV